MSEQPLQAALNQLAESIARRLIELQGEHAPPPSPGNDSPWLSLERAANYLDWPKQRLYKLCAQGAIPHYKHDGRLLFNRSELDHWRRDFAQPEPRLAEAHKQSYS